LPNNSVAKQQRCQTTALPNNSVAKQQRCLTTALPNNSVAKQQRCLTTALPNNSVAKQILSKAGFALTYKASDVDIMQTRALVCTFIIMFNVQCFRRVCAPMK
jgi:hypothetical protein